MSEYHEIVDDTSYRKRCGAFRGNLTPGQTKRVQTVFKSQQFKGMKTTGALKKSISPAVAGIQQQGASCGSSWL